MSARPARDGAGTDARPAVLPRAATRREHAFRSLLELGRELTVSGDLYGTADLLMFNLMGQLGAARAALWLRAEDVAPGAPAVLVRAHGVDRQLAHAAGLAAGPALARQFETAHAAMSAEALAAALAGPERTLIAQSQLVWFAPVRSRGECIGWLGLGARVDGVALLSEDLEVLEAQLGLAGAALQNTRLYQRLLEGNRRLRDTNHRLQELDRLKSEFLANVNHELRTPLAIAIGALECVAGDPGGHGRSATLVQAALQKSRELQALIENLLRFSDELASRAPVRLELADVGEVVDAWCAERQPGVTAGLREMTYCREPVPPARFDRERLFQVLNELMDNAVKFTPRGARLQVEVRGLNDGDGSWVGVSLADDGPGIPADRMEALFRSFEQLDGSSTRTAGGLGMGLALARRMAERMNCRLDAASTPGRGTTFTVRIPIAAS